MYTARQIFEATEIELNKIQAPSLKLYEFNYLVNKAINQYVNKIYNIYDINQQTTDDLRVLKSTAYLQPIKFDSSNHSSIQSLYGATYEVYMPLDYLHLLNCVCVYEVKKQKDCWDVGNYVPVSAIKLTADSWGDIITDIYNRPSPMRPYYYIHNVNRIGNELPTNPVLPNNNVPNSYEGTDINGNYKVVSYDQEEVATTVENQDGEVISTEGSNFNRKFKLNGTPKSGVEKPTASRISNSSNVRLEIRYGRDNSVFELKEVQIDYLKAPQFIRLTQEQMDLTQDTSQIMEYPDYVCQEIINELVHLIMLRTRDPQLGDHYQITSTIARPTQQQQQPAQQS